MPRITAFDKSSVRTAADKLLAALKPVAEELGLHFAYKGSTISPKSAILKFELATVDESGTAETQERTDFKQYASLFGLQPSDLDREFTSGGRTFRIAGLRPRATKKPIIVEREGQQYIFTAEAILQLLGRS